MVENPETLQLIKTEIPHVLPVLPLSNAVAFPVTIIPLNIGQSRSIELVDEAMRNHRLVILVAQKSPPIELPGPENLYDIGTVGFIHQLIRTSDKNLKLLVQGLERTRIHSYTSIEPYLMAQHALYPDIITTGVEADALRHVTHEQLKQLYAYVKELPTELLTVIESMTDILQFIYLVAVTLPLPFATRQELLELESTDKKLHKLIDWIQHELTVRELGKEITAKTEERLTKAQRERFLREQVQSIQKELGEEEGDTDLKNLRRSLEEANLPNDACREVERELKRLGTLSSASPEYSMIRTYLEWMASLPWNKLSGETINITHAERILDEDHYDLEKIKERILEYLAVRKLRQERLQTEESSSEASTAPQASKDTKSSPLIHEPILCFLGPPGVGKTSLGQSIARALGRSFERISLGGLHDEAEIRGHRRTYIGAMPGRIIQAIKRSSTRNPVLMLDEIDKVGADWRGDPASALLEVLDPAQNQNFTDNYLGVAFDLSQVLFIATANTLDPIPAPLLDRMEVLSLSGYTDEEKFHIAKNYLIPKQIMAHALQPNEVTFDEDALGHITRAYTREAGVRNLERQIATICRKVAKRIAEGTAEQARITKESLADYLGQTRYFDEVVERTSHPGVATGMAWTPTGGEILFVEATMMPSHKEKLILTGMLGKVMRESARTALSYIQSNLQLLKIDPHLLENKVIHLHVPAGAIPKDGPSAGVTMVTALASLLTKRAVRNDVAMTGEITLRGKVLPIGGVKEKVLAAHRAGIKVIILPNHNKRDLQDIPKQLRDELTFYWVESIDEIFEIALESKKSEAHSLASKAALETTQN